MLKNANSLSKRLFASCTMFLALFGLLSSLSSAMADAIQGMDPGLTNGHATQTRRGNLFSINVPNSNKSYQLVAVAEQGSLQDSRPFDIIDGRDGGKLDYQSAASNNVSPFYFDWSNSLGRLTARLEIDTLSEPYFYRNKAGLETTPRSPVLRDQPRTVYRNLPSDFGNPSLPQVKNSLDDFVHFAFFERDVVTPTEYLGDIDNLSYTLQLRNGGTNLDHPANLQSQSSSLRPRTGSRIVASMHWSEDVDNNGQHEVYLIELNIGGSSNNPAWQSAGRCVQDDATHTNVISGQYLVLGGEAFLGTDVIPLPASDTQTLSIDWSDILWQLRNVQQQGDCKLRATLNPIPNTVALGVAIEARGAVQQTLEIAGITAGSEAVSDVESIELTPDLSSSTTPQDVPVVIQSVPSSDRQTNDVTTATATPATAQIDGSTIVNNPGEPFVANNAIHLPAAENNTRWWQILLARDWSSLCETDNAAATTVPAQFNADGSAVCHVGPGRYSVIDHGGGHRWDNVIVPFSVDTTSTTVEIQSGSFGNTLLFNTITGVLSWDQTGWYQVQTFPGLENVCQSFDHCDIQAGTYNIINHTSGERWEHIVIAGN